MSQHKLLQLIDQVKPNLQPLNTHYMAQFSVAERQDYATMLAAIITGAGTVTEAQSRLFGMLLTSMELENEVANYYKMAQEIDVDYLTLFFKKYRDTDVLNANIFDGLCLHLLDDNKEVNQLLLSEYFSISDVDIEVITLFNIMIKVVIDINNNILGFLYDRNICFELICNHIESEQSLLSSSEKECLLIKLDSINFGFGKKLAYEKTGKDINNISDIFLDISFSDVKLELVIEQHKYVREIEVQLNLPFKIFFKNRDYLSAWSEFFKDLEVKK